MPAPMPAPLLQIQHISLQRGDQRVLHDISLDVLAGEVLLVIGPSGSGKSSLLRCINRLSSIDSGTIRFGGENIENVPVTELRRRIGMLFQKSAPFDGTVADNIGYGPALRGETLSRDSIRRLMQQAALEEGLIDRDARQLSGGQEQRLAIARALANRPSLLLLDEPTSALDPIATQRIEQALLTLRLESGLSMIWVSHAVEQARRVADRVLLLQDGRVVRIDTADAMLNRQTGDERALAFERGVEGAQQHNDAQADTEQADTAEDSQHMARSQAGV